MQIKKYDNLDKDGVTFTAKNSYSYVAFNKEDLDYYLENDLLDNLDYIEAVALLKRVKEE